MTMPDRAPSHAGLAAAALTLLAIASSMGCLSFSFGGRQQPAEDPSVLAQSGSVTVPKGQVKDVFYPVPYPSPPNLELDDSFHHYVVIDQQADHFRVRNDSGAWDVKWTARGVRAVQ